MSPGRASACGCFAPRTSTISKRAWPVCPRSLSTPGSSPASRHLTEKELAYLTELDGYDHFAIGVARLDDDDHEDGVGVGRFVRLPGEPAVAEPAVVVVDDMQNRGIGTLLMNRLIEAAKERDVEVFRSEFLARNAPVKQLLEDISPHIRYEGHGAVVTAEIPLRPTTALVRTASGDGGGPEPFDALQALLRGVLRHGGTARRSRATAPALDMLFDPDDPAKGPGGSFTQQLRKHRAESDA